VSWRFLPCEIKCQYEKTWKAISRQPLGVHEAKNRRFQTSEPAVWIFSLIRFPPLGLPNRFKGSPRRSGVSQPVQLPQQIHFYFTPSRVNVKLEKTLVSMARVS
jgi:hypothetical protein